MRWSRAGAFAARARRTSSVRGQRGARCPAIRGQHGFLLIEVLVAMAIFGVVSVTFMGALVAGYRGVLVAHEQTMAESLTRTALEDVRHADFPYATASDNVTTVSRFDVRIHADNVTLENDYSYTVVTDASSYQMITVTVSDHESGRNILQTQEAKSQS